MAAPSGAEDAPTLIRIVGLASGAPTEAAGRYVKRFHPEVAGGRGLLVTTPFLSEARVYESRQDAWRHWQSTSMKAFTVELVSLPRFDHQ